MAPGSFTAWGSRRSPSSASPPRLPQTYTLNTLANFSSTNGRYPYGGLVLSGGNLYGTTIQGGPSGYGEVYSVPTTGGTPTVIVSFNGTNGNGSVIGLTLNGSTLYGTTYSGGANGYGTVFALTPVPEASSAVSMGVMLMLALAALVLHSRRRSGPRA